MKRKIFTILSLMIMSLCASLGLSACETLFHKHRYIETVAAQTCAEQGYTTYSCECGKNYVDNYVNAKGHAYVQGVCSICKKFQTEGLEYTLIDDTSYSVTGIGSCLDTDIYIPSIYNEKPVTSIGDSAFYNCGSLVSITISNNVMEIGERAFSDCISLTNIVMPNSLTSISRYAFYNCINLMNIKIPNSVTSIGDYAIHYTGYYNDKSNWENEVLYIGEYLIRAKQGVNSEYVVKNGTRYIADCAFEYCWYLKNVVIPDSIMWLGEAIFRGSEDFTEIFYKGTAEDWAKIDIGSSNSELTEVTIYYYVENESDLPTDGGKYWRYVDGVPTAW